MKKIKKKKRRSDTKIITREATVLKVMRESRKLSMRRAAVLAGVSDTFINQHEHGRLDLNPEIIHRLLIAYGYSHEEFIKFQDGLIMAIKLYERDGKTLYQVYVNVRSKTNPQIRAQKTVSDLQSHALARREENRINLELGKRILELEGKADTWESIVIKWEKEVRSGLIGEYKPATIRDHVYGIHNWTASWMNLVATEIGKAQGRDLVNRMTEAGKSVSFIKKIKNTVNVIYNF